MLEEPVKFFCRDQQLYGILHIPDKDVAAGVVVTLVTGGPQTRYGGHRNYVRLARYLCSKGITAFRFDCAGMGDSEGDFTSYKNIGPSIVAAIDFLKKRFQRFSGTIIYSLCDGCLASINTAAENQSSIAGLVMVNPFILEEEYTIAKAKLRQYYLRRLYKTDFWYNLIKFNINLIPELKELLAFVRTAISNPDPEGFFPRNKKKQSISKILFTDMRKINKPLWFIASTEDIVAMEFLYFLKKNSKKWNFNDDMIKEIVVNGADHTFTQPKMQKELFKITQKAVHYAIEIQK